MSHANESVPVVGSGVDDSMSGNVIRGYKATLSNPRTSEEAKEKARDILAGNADPSDYAENATTDQHTNRVLGGYKATLSNPNTSDEAKANARLVFVHFVTFAIHFSPSPPVMAPVPSTRQTTSSSRATSSISSSFAYAREAILGRAFIPPATIPGHTSNADPLRSEHSSQKPRPRKAPAVNTRLTFEGVSHAVLAPIAVGWEGSFKIVEGSMAQAPLDPLPSRVVHRSQRDPSNGPHSPSLTKETYQQAAEQVEAPSLAIALHVAATTISTSSAYPTNQLSPASIARGVNTFVRTSISHLPPAARPFTYSSGSRVPRALSSRNIYAPRFVRGKGWVPAFGEAAEQTDDVPPAPVEQAIAKPRYPARANRTGKSIPNNSNTAAADIVEDGSAPVPNTEKPANASHSKSHKGSRGKASGKGKSSKAASRPPPAPETTPQPVEAPTPAVPAKRKRVRLQDHAEELASIEEEDPTPTTADPAGLEQEAEAEGGRTTRSSKRRKITTTTGASPELMPPPSDLPNTRPSAKKTSSRDESASVDAAEPNSNLDNEKEKESVSPVASVNTRRTRSSRRGKESADAETESASAGNEDGNNHIVQGDNEAETTEKATTRSLRAKRRGSQDQAKSSPPPVTTEKRTHKKSNVDASEQAAPAPASSASSTSTATAQTPASASPAVPTHSYSTRRAGAISRSSNTASAPTNRRSPLQQNSTQAKERISPSSRSDQTVVDRAAVSSGPTKIGLEDVPSHHTRVAVV
ncbi:hypothetical protein FRB99_000426 [Tulasnella sp. 403]|nr:hypothetical protein FRB99_000426 [Tulasnella sp. 403]